MSLVRMIERLWRRLNGPPVKRSVGDVIMILERELQGALTVDEWDDFISVPIEDPELEAIRTANWAAGHELPTTRATIERCLRELRARRNPGQ